ncbi:MAG: NusA-like transcription termination signal-binding factor [Candidatus Anstonellales archaeon]
MEIGETELFYLSEFEKITHVMPSDVAEVNETLFFLVPKNLLGKAIGKKGFMIPKLEKKFKKKVLIFADSENPEEFIKNFFNNVKPMEIEIRDAMGERGIFFSVSEAERGIALGKGGCRIKAARKFVEKKFNAKLYLKTKKAAFF